MPIHKYPSIDLLYRRPEIFAVKEVVATEKLHGSQFRIYFPPGMESLADVRYGSHETEYTPGESFPLMKAVQWFQNQPHLLASMWEVIKIYDFSEVTIFGEAFGPGIKSKGVRYSMGQNTLFRAFDLMVGSNLISWDLFCEVTEKMFLPRVPEVWRGDPNKEDFDLLLNLPSLVGRFGGIEDETNLAEGVVIRSNPLMRNVFGELIIVKHKAGKFAEVAHAPKEKVRVASPVDAFSSTFVTEGRIRNAIGRLQDRGTILKNDMTDVPTLIDEVVADLYKECKTELDALIVPDLQKSLRGSVSRILGPLYRQLLEESSDV